MIAPTRITVDVGVEAPGWRVLDDPERLAEEAVGAALAEADIDLAPDAEVSVLLTDDAAVRALNARFRNKDRPTNVLSFPPSRPGLLLGDIVLALETVLGEAERDGKTAANHVAHLLVHGTLHLVGHDHETETQAEAMEALERRALARLGIADPYRVASAG